MRWLAVCSLLLVTTAARASFIDNIMAQIISIFQTYDEAPYNVTTTAPGYEEREYDARKWVCSEESGAGDQELGTLFWRLFQYISGENSKKEKISMTIPVTTEFSLKGPTDKTYCMCFLIEQQHQNDPPKPTNTEVFIERRPKMRILTRTVGGYISNEPEWMEEAGMLAAVIQENGQSVSLSHMYWVGYDSPLKFWYRRNEVWFPLF